MSEPRQRGGPNLEFLRSSFLLLCRGMNEPVGVRP